MRPVCCACSVEMRCQRNEVYAICRTDGRLGSCYYSGDRYECPECGARVLTGFGSRMDQFDRPLDPDNLNSDLLQWVDWRSV